jgi:FxsC-like protein
MLPKPVAEPLRLDTQVPRRGLRQLVRLSGLRMEYRKFLDRLAQQVIDVAAAYPLPRGTLPTWADTPNAFEITGDPRAPHIHFVVAAGSRQEMEGVRDDLAYYGPTPRQWSPYLPASSEPIADHARALAADRLMESDVGDLDDMVDRIRGATENNEIVVLLLDPWATRLDAYRKILAEVDRQGHGVTVLAPASRTDPETAQYRDELRFAVQRTFRRHREADAMFPAEIETSDGFVTELSGAIEEGRNRLFREGRLYHLPPGELPGERPILRGP